MLRVLRRPSPRPTGLLILLPGYGDRPEPLVAVADVVDPDGVWDVVVCEPRLVGPGGPRWYEVDDDGPRIDELDDSRRAVLAVADEQLAATGLDADRLVVAGFSQGGALALATAVHAHDGATPQAVAVLAGYLADHPDVDLDRSRDRCVLVAHGEDDPVVDPVRGRSAARALARHGALVTWRSASGGHRLAPPLLDPLTVWLRALAADERPHDPIH